MRALLFSFALLAAAEAVAENGVTDKEITLGMVNAQTGASASLGQELKTGSMVYIEKINKAGGVHGRMIKVNVYDDQYDPKLTAEMVTKAIDQDKVFALFDTVGTPTGAAAVPLIGKANIPLVGMFTGAQAFRQRRNCFVVARAIQICISGIRLR